MLSKDICGKHKENLHVIFYGTGIKLDCMIHYNDFILRKFQITERLLRSMQNT